MNNVTEWIELESSNVREGQKMLLSQYNPFKDFILETLQAKGQITLTELVDLATEKFNRVFGGDVAWSLLQIKNDLVERGLVSVYHEKNHKQIVSIYKKENKGVRMERKKLKKKNKQVVINTRSKYF